MYVNSKMGGEVIKENGGGDEFKYDILIHCKNFRKCHNVPQLSTIKGKKKKRMLSQPSSHVYT
jgi:hypothetical protein